jgi:hypothetical protein
MASADESCLQWRKSSRTNANNNDCVELAEDQASVAVRDSKHPDGPRLRFSRQEFGSLITKIRRL